VRGTDLAKKLYPRNGALLLLLIMMMMTMMIVMRRMTGVVGRSWPAAAHHSPNQRHPWTCLAAEVQTI
jgi:hypothetical protein